MCYLPRHERRAGMNESIFLADRMSVALRIPMLPLLFCMGFSGCTKTAPEVIPPSAIQKALIGKTPKELMACTAVQPEQSTMGDLTMLRYYKEASILEESFAVSKSSVARVHHGCWATLGIKNDRVEGVQYDSVPAYSGHEDHCDEIFQSCLGQ